MVSPEKWTRKPSARGGNSRAVSPVSEPGRDEYTKGGYEQGMFAEVRSVQDFGRVLQIPLAAIPLVSPSDKLCRSAGCPFNAIENNTGFCPAHKRTWYSLRNNRGGDLYGPEFLRSAVVKGSTDCHCNSKACKSAGYFPGQGAFYIPAQGHSTVIGTPVLLSQDKIKKLRENKRESIYLYPWHFLPEHRTKGPDGLWKLNYVKRKKGEEPTKYRDLERRPYDFPPPRYAPQIFVSDEYFAAYVRPQDRWAQSSNNQPEMPDWMANILALDRFCSMLCPICPSAR